MFSREEGETIDEYNQEQNEDTIPIGIRVKPDDASSVATTEEQTPLETPSMSSLPDRLVYFSLLVLYTVTKGLSASPFEYISEI